MCLQPAHAPGVYACERAHTEAQHANVSAHPPPRYIKERDLDWSYWPLDGQQGPSRTLGADESYGLLNATWDGWAYPPLLEQLRALA